MVQFQLLFDGKTMFEKNGAHHFSLFGRHLQSVGRTEPVFELTLALSEERPTNECRSDSGIVLLFTMNIVNYVNFMCTLPE